MAKVYEAADLEEPLNQGDVLSDVPLLARRNEAIEVLPNRAVITSHGCDNEKYLRQKEKDASQKGVLETYPVMFAPVYVADSVGDAGYLGDVAAGRVRRYFYLPAEDEHPARVVDLFYEQPVPAMLVESSKPSNRLTPEWWMRLLVHMWVRRSRLEPDDVFRKDVVDDAS